MADHRTNEVPGDAGYNIEQFQITENLVDKYRAILQTPEKTMYQRIIDLEKQMKLLELRRRKVK